MINIKKIIVFLALIPLAFCICKAEYRFPDLREDSFVYDCVGEMSEEEIAETEEKCKKLKKFYRTTLVGVYLSDIGDTDIESYTLRLAEEMKLNKKSVLFVIVDNINKSYIYTGSKYKGWFKEGVLDTSYDNQERIFRDYFKYFFKQLGATEIDEGELKKAFPGILALLLAVIFALVGVISVIRVKRLIRYKSPRSFTIWASRGPDKYNVRYDNDKDEDEYDYI